MGLFGISGDTWKKIGGYALKAAPYIAAPFTGGLSIPIGMAIQGGIGAAQGAAGGGGLKGALIGGGVGAGLGAIPGGTAASGLVKNLVKPALTMAGGAAENAVMNSGSGGSSTTAPTTPGGAPATAPDGTPIPPNDGSPGWAAKWGPLLAQGAGIGAGILAGKAATSSALQRSPEETAALGGENTAASGLGTTGTSMLSAGTSDVAKPASYYQKLLTGDRNAMQEATAAPRAQIQDEYGGAERGLTRSGVRGAARDVLGGGLEKDKAAKISALTTGVQPWAASQLASLGTNQQQTGASLVANSGNIYGNMLGDAYKNRVYSRQEGAAAGKPIGQLAAMAGTIPFGSTATAAANALKKKPATGVPGTVGTPPPTFSTPGAALPVGNPGAPSFSGWATAPPGTYDNGDYSDAANY